MNTAEKLNILMNITNTTNAELGQALHFDTSYVSRIRSGKRGVPKKVPFIELASDYLSRQITEEVQRTALSQVILGGERLPSDTESIRELIANYLGNDRNETDISVEPVAKLLSGMSNMIAGSQAGSSMESPVKTPVNISAPVPDAGISTENLSIFYNNEGKREAIRIFLRTLLAEGKAFKLFLSSDEDMRWMIEDRKYAAEWMQLLLALLQNGSTIQIIHHVNRNLSEMLNAIVQWSPLYLTGAIEPYYYPFIRDGIYRRSVFVAEGHSAVFSTSVCENTGNMANFLTYDKKLVASLKDEYTNYFSLCKPLMQIYSPESSRSFLDDILDKNASGKYIMASPTPSIWSIEPEMARTMLKRYGNESFVKTQQEIYEQFISVLENGGEVTELITINPDQNSLPNAIPVPHCDLFGCPTLCYTKEEYITQLRNMEELSKKYSGYHVLFTDKIPQKILIYSHSERDAILSGCAPPTAAFVIRQPQLASAFFEYLLRIESNLRKM